MRRVKNYWQLKLNPELHSKITCGFTQDTEGKDLNSYGWERHFVHKNCHFVCENCSRAVLVSVKEMLRCGYSCPTASRHFPTWPELHWRSLSGLYFSFYSEFHSKMLKGVRMKALRKICPLIVRNHWSDGKIPSLWAQYRNQQRTDLSVAVVDKLKSEVSIIMIQLRHGQRSHKSGLDPSVLPGL